MSEALLMFYWSLLKSTHKSYSKIRHAVTIPNFPQKVAENQYADEGF